MGIQQQVQESPVSQKRKGLPWKQVRRVIYILVAIALVFFIVGAIFWILMTLGIIHGPVFDKLFVILNGLGGATIAVLAFFGVIQFILSLIPNPTEPTTATSSTPSTSTAILPTSSPPQTMPVPQPDKAPYRSIIDLPPPTDSKTIQQRGKAVRQVYDKLTQPDITALVLTGIGGIGKSILAALIYNYAEEQRRTRKGPFTADPLWLRIDPSVTMADIGGTLLEALGKPMPGFGHLDSRNQAVVLFEALNTVDRPRLIVFDQFENLLDFQTGRALTHRPGIGEWIDALNGEACRCRILLTSRPRPQGTNLEDMSYMKEYVVQHMELVEGIELLRKREVTIADESEEELGTLVEFCSGHPLKLSLLATILHNHNLSPSAFIRDRLYADLLKGKMERRMLNDIYKQLNEVQRKLLFAFSIYREPVPFSAAQNIMDFNVMTSTEQKQDALEVLLGQHLLQAVGEGRYQLHAIVAEYARNHFVEGDEQANQEALRTLHIRAAQYYVQQATTSSFLRGQRQHISDVHSLVEAIWHQFQAKQWPEAYKLMDEEKIFVELRRWGDYGTLRELYQELLDNWQPEHQQAGDIYNNLGQIYSSLGQKADALNYYKQALDIRKEGKDREREAETLSYISRIYIDQKMNWDQTQRYLEQALEIYKEVGNLDGESMVRVNLGRLYTALQMWEQAQLHLEQAIEKCREMGNRVEESRGLHYLGRLYAAQGVAHLHEAQKYLQQALTVAKKTGDRLEETRNLQYLGLLYIDLGQHEEAQIYLQQAVTICEELGDLWGKSTALNALGRNYADLGQKEQALKYYWEALHVRRILGNSWGEGETLDNIGKFYFREERYNVALACFLLADGIFEELHHQSRNKTQSSMEELRKRIGEEQFNALLVEVEPRAIQIVEQALQDGSGTNRE